MMAILHPREIPLQPSKGPGPLVPGKATDGPAAATTPAAGRGAFRIAVYFLTCCSKVRSRRLPSTRVESRLGLWLVSWLLNGLKDDAIAGVTPGRLRDIESIGGPFRYRYFVRLCADAAVTTSAARQRDGEALFGRVRASCADADELRSLLRVLRQYQLRCNKQRGGR